MVLAITPLLSFTHYSTIALETKFGKTTTLLMKSLGIAVYIYLSLWYKDVTIIQWAVSSKDDIANIYRRVFLTFPSLYYKTTSGNSRL